MRLVTYYRAALLVPIAIPAILALLPQLGIFDPHSVIMLPMGASVGIAGIPYVACAIILWRLARNKDGAFLRGLCLASPAIMLVLYCVWDILHKVMIDGVLDAPFFNSLQLFAVFVVIIGFIYVAIVESMRAFGEYRGWLHDAVAHSSAVEHSG